MLIRTHHEAAARNPGHGFAFMRLPGPRWPFIHADFPSPRYLHARKDCQLCDKHAQYLFGNL
jgi:hypothetical protein